MSGHRVISTLYQSKTSRVERASTEHGPVIVKTLKREAFTPATVARFRREYAINRSLEGDFVCRALALVDAEAELSIVFEDSNGEPLNELLARAQLPIEQAGEIALGLASALHASRRKLLRNRNVTSTSVDPRRWAAYC